MEQRYNVYFAGQLLDGQQREAVRANLAKLFNANDATLDKLFSGKPQLVKKECDKTTALKYKQAMERAGALPVIKLVADSGEPPERALSAAEKIAALAAAPDTGVNSTSPQEQASQADTDSLDLCPDGTEVLRPQERAVPVPADIDTSGLEVDSAADRLSQEAPAPAPAPDTSHLAMGEVGETIPTLPPEHEAVNPNTDALALSPEGTDFSDCNAPDAPPPDLDLSALDLAPEGTEVIRDSERKQAPAEPAPETDHIKLAD
jgi:hypothetical protein